MSHDDNASLILEFASNTPSNHATTVIGAVIQGNCAFHPTAPMATVHAFDNVLSPESWPIRLAQWESHAGKLGTPRIGPSPPGSSVKTEVEGITHAHPSVGFGHGKSASKQVEQHHQRSKTPFPWAASNTTSTISIGLRWDLLTRDASNQTWCLGRWWFCRASRPMAKRDSGHAGLVLCMHSDCREKQRFSKPPRTSWAKFAATTQGPAHHDSQDLGPEGPDFQFGFGHMQTDVAEVCASAE